MRTPGGAPVSGLDDDIVAALRESPGDPPPVDLYPNVVAGARRRRRHRLAATAVGSAVCVVVAIAVVPVLMRGGGSHVAPPAGASGAVAPTCAPSMESHLSPTRTPAGEGFVPGTPTSAVLCEYAAKDPNEMATAPLQQQVSLTPAQLGKTVLILHDLKPTNEAASCPAPVTERRLTFGYADGATVTLQIGCAMVWQSDRVHALLADPLRAWIDALLASVPDPSPSPSTSAFAPIAGGGTVLELDDAQHFTIVDLATGATKPVALPGIPGGPSLVATNPAGGWVVTYTPDENSQWNQASSQLAVVNAAGVWRPFGPVYASDTPITTLAVSPDGTRVAVALMQAFGGAPPASIVVMPTPGHVGPTQSWPVADDSANEIESLSWAPDGKRLTYIAGFQTGAGIGGDPITLDTSKPGKAPTKSSWNASSGCDVDGAAWLGSSGRFAVVRDCANPELVEVDASTGAPKGPPVSLTNAGCLGPELHSSLDGSRLLLARCSSVSLVIDGKLTSLGAHVIDAAWAG